MITQPRDHDRFAAEIRHRGELAIIDLIGDLDHAAEEGLGQAWSQACSAGRRPVLLNFERVGYINSIGIALIVQVLAQSRARGCPIRVCGLSDHFRHVFEITRLVDFVSFVTDEQAAAGEVAAAPRP